MPSYVYGQLQRGQPASSNKAEENDIISICWGKAQEKDMTMEIALCLASVDARKEHYKIHHQTLPHWKKMRWMCKNNFTVDHCKT